MKPTEHDIRDTGQLPRCTGCGTPHGILDRSVTQASVTRGPGHRELWAAMLCERCAVKLVERASALDAASAKPADESPRSLYAKLMQQSTPAAPEKPACEHEWGAKILGDDSFVKWCGKCGQEQPVGLSMGSAMSLSKPACEPDDDVRCEACSKPSIRVDADGMHLCADCFEEARQTEVPAPSSPAAFVDAMEEGMFKPAAERADEGLEEEAEKLCEAFHGPDTTGWTHAAQVKSYEEGFLRVARAARALRRGGVTEADEALCEMTIRAEERRTERDALAAKLAEAERRERETRAALKGHTDPKNCDGCGCMAATTAEMAEVIQREAEREEAARIEAVKALAEAQRAVGAARIAESRAGEALVDEIGKREQAQRERDTARAEAERLRGERDEARDQTIRLCSAPTINVTDVEEAAERIVQSGKQSFRCIHDNSVGDVGGLEVWCRECIEAILRDCTRAASVEEIARALELMPVTPGEHWWNDAARAALRALGVREAEKDATPFVVNWTEMHGALCDAYDAITKTPSTRGGNMLWDSGAMLDAVRIEYERQRAEHEKGGAA